MAETRKLAAIPGGEVVGFRRLAGSEERSWITHLRDSKSGSSRCETLQLSYRLGSPVAIARLHYPPV